MCRHLIPILACIIMAPAIACAAGDKAVMPLAVGNRWEYSVTEFGVMSIGEGSSSRSMQTESEGTCTEEVISIKEKRPNGDVVYEHRSVTNMEAGLNTEADDLTIDSLLLASEKGVFILASKASGLKELSSKWVKYDPPLVLFGSEMSPGSDWKVGTVKEDELRMPMTAMVAGYETVTVPAGTFENCIKIYVVCENVKGTIGSGKDKTTVKSGKSVSTAWILPSVGVIKEESIIQMKMQFPPDEYGPAALMTGTHRKTKGLLPGYRVGTP